MVTNIEVKLNVFADRVNVRNHWSMVQVLAHTLVLNYDIPLALY